MANIYLMIEGKQQGPYTEGQIRHMLKSGAATPKNLGWHEGITDWIPVGLIIADTPAHVPVSKLPDLNNNQPISASPDRSVVLQPVQNNKFTNGVVSRKTFRILVVVSFLFLFVSIVFDTSIFLPEPLASYKKGVEDSTSLPLIITDLVLLSVLLVSYVGLFFAKKWARISFAIGLGCCYLIGLFSPPTVESAVANTFGSLSDICTGAVLAIAFFTSLFEVAVKQKE